MGALRRDDAVKVVRVGDVIASRRWTNPFPGALEGPARLLLQEGVNLLAATSCELARGTPVYVHAAAGAATVQRRMAQHHIRTVPVLDAGRLIGCLDLLELAGLAEPLSPPA